MLSVLQETMGFISDRDLLQVIDHNMIIGSTVRRRDVQIASDIYGPNINSLKGKTVRNNEKHVREDANLDVPAYIMDRYRDVTLSIDIMHVNGILFFIGISRHIKHIVVVPINKKDHQSMLESIDKVSGIYEARGFNIKNVYMDNAFECLRDDLRSNGRNIELNVVAANEHEPNIERCIRHVKERCRATFASLNFQHLPRRLVTELVCSAIYWINSVPRKDGVHPTISPRTILTGQVLTEKHVRFQFGDFVQATEPPKANNTKNSMTERTSDAIYCRPSGNQQGGYSVYKISTAQVVHRNSVTLANSSDVVAEQLAAIATNEKMPVGLNFGDRHGNATILDFDDDSQHQQDDDISDGEFSDHDDQLDDDHTLGSLESILDEEDTDDNDDENSNNHDSGHENRSDSDYHSDDDSIGNDTPPGIENNYDEADDDSTGDSESGSDSDSDHDQSERRSSRSRQGPERYVAGPASGKSSSVLAQASVVFFQAVSQYQKIEATMSTKQYGMKAGLKIFGDGGLDAVSSEIRDNLHGRGVIEPVRRERVTHHIRMESLSYLMFLKRKRSGKIKGRGCADGRKQREYITRAESSSPTVSTPALMATCLLDAIEGRFVATIDIPGAFLQATMDDEVYIKFENEMVDVLVGIDPERYGPCVCEYKGRKFLYARAIKAIYGCLKSALLFYKLFTGELKKWGFKPNAYDACTMNKMVNNKQMTIVWHVDDCKISHKSEAVVRNMLAKIEARFGQESPVSVTTGTVHDYLGMTIDYSIKNKVKFYMFDYIEQILSEVDPTLMTGSCRTPATANLFKINENGTKLSTKDADAFHRNVARLLFLSKRARPDIQTAVAFLCTRVQSPDVDDNNKLGRVMRYLRETIFLPLVIGWDGTGNFYWSVDASFAVHNDMKSHTGGVLTLGLGSGALIAMSTKQKLNTTSSTEAELVAVSDSMPFNLWIKYFFAEQGVGVDGYIMGKRNILYQDNESCIKLANNGKASSSKRTRHIHIRYFFVTDRVKGNELEIEYCPTEEMLGDFFTKPLTGQLFAKFRNNILGITEEDYRSYKEEYYKAKANNVTTKTNSG